jgi:hypothetical protein
MLRCRSGQEVIAQECLHGATPIEMEKVCPPPPYIEFLHKLLQ